MQKFLLTKHVWIRKNLSVWLAGDCNVGLSSPLLFGSKSSIRAMQLSTDENDATCDLIYMIMLCMHACNLPWGPLALRLFLCCSGSSLGFVQKVTYNFGKACTKGWLSGRARQPRLTGRTYRDTQYYMSFAIECHLRSLDGLRRV